MTIGRPRRLRARRGVGLVAVLAALLLTLAGTTAATAVAVAPRASLTDIEMQVMCVTCGIPLSVAESPQADHERDFIRGLIAKGETTAQIKQALVAQLGPQVLALPGDHGFDLAVYIVPVAVIALVGAMLAVAARRWRRRGPDDEDEDDGVDDDGRPREDVLSVDDAARLDDELARYPT
jgi:cytochrome c-type biogenesis protein CcmH/NrfF